MIDSVFKRFIKNQSVLDWIYYMLAVALVYMFVTMMIDRFQNGNIPNAISFIGIILLLIATAVLHIINGVIDAKKQIADEIRWQKEKEEEELSHIPKRDVTH